jgi:hypothetical protein
MPPLPFQNNTLGVSPEVLGPFWDQYQFSESPNGNAMMGVASDCAVVFALSNAQLLALQSTAVQLVAPPVVAGLPSYLVPANGYLYVPTTLTLEYRFATAGFTLGNADNRLQIEYTGQSVNLISMLATGLLTLGSNAIATNVAPTPGPITTLATSANLGLEVKLAGTTPALTVGGGTVVVHMLYNVYALI